MFVVFYWQLAPVLMASLGASLDLKKLLVYPIPPTQLFGVEVLLRLSTCVEMMLLVTGVAVGLLRNPAVPGHAAPVALFLLVLFNLLLAAGLRYQIERLMARRRMRELLLILLVTMAALPQLLLTDGVARSAPPRVGRLLGSLVALGGYRAPGSGACLIGRLAGGFLVDRGCLDLRPLAVLPQLAV